MQKKHLGHADTSRNNQNNCIKLSSFGVDKTKRFLHCEVTRNISCREKFFNPKVLCQDQSNILWPLSLPFYFGLNKTGNKVISE